MEYADVLWDGCTESESRLLGHVQYEAAKIVTGDMKGVEGLNVINCPKCNKVLNVINFQAANYSNYSNKPRPIKLRSQISAAFFWRKS